MSDGTASELLAYLAQRHSVGPKHLLAPAPTDAQWAQAAAVAQRAPDHGGLRPFRFVRVDSTQRPRLAELFAADAASRGHGAAEVETARARAFNGPGLVALVARVRDGVPDVPPHEQWLSVGGALMNLLNALHLMGFGAKALSGASVRNPDIRAAFCEPGEDLVAWVIAGTPLRSAQARRGADGPAVISHWSGG